MIEKKKQGEHTTITTPPGFSIRSCILQPFSEQTQLFLILRLLSLINLRLFLVMQAPRVYPTCFPSLDQGLMMQEK